MTSVAMEGPRWTRASYAYALVVSGLLGYFLMRIPIQVSDCFSDVVSLGRPLTVLVRDALSQHSFLRPGRWVEAKLVYDLSGGQYFYAFRLVHVAHVVALVLLFVRMVRPRTPADGLSLPLALAVLVGCHTFAWTLREAFPINHYLTIVVACAAAANLAWARPRWWNDVLAVSLLVASALTIESGVLVWLILAGAYAVGLRGVSRAGLLATTAALALYFVLRFAVLGVGVPTLFDREAGFGFHRYGGGQLVAIFGTHVILFHAYNVMASILGLLVAEPRDGVFRLVESLQQHDVNLPLLIGTVSSLLATTLICWFTWVRRRAWRARRFERDDQLVALFWIVLVGNAALGYAYTKDVIMAPAGVFYAAAVFAGCRHLVSGPSGRRFATVVLLGALSCTWAVRMVGIQAALADTAVDVREQWAFVDEWIAQRNFPMTPHAEALKRQLQDDAVLNHPAKPLLLERWTRLFEK